MATCKFTASPSWRFALTVLNQAQPHHSKAMQGCFGWAVAAPIQVMAVGLA